MAVPAKCENCANDPQNRPSYPIQPPANLGVVLGVIGGCALVALVVAIVVPLVRRRARPNPSASVRRSLYRKVRDGDVERGAEVDARTNARVLYLPSRRSSFRHQKVFAGPDAQPLLPLLLDPLRPISALTWSDFHSRRSKSQSQSPPRTSTSSTDGTTDGSSRAMSDEDEYADGRAPERDRDRESLSTNRATTSHRSTSSRSAREREAAFRRDEQGRPQISNSTSGGYRARALPQPPRSPTPPGLPSKREYSIYSARRASLPLPITPTSPADQASAGMPHLFAPVPVSLAVPSPATASASAAGGSALSRHPSSRHRTGTLKPGMEPVLEDDAYAETRSLQLPSPPASPEQAQPQPHHRSSSSRRRPSLTPSQSAPLTTSTSYRPRSSTGPAIPLTAAFQTSVLRSGSQSTAGSSAGHHHRYPSIVTSSTRARPTSVQVAPSSSAGGLLSPESPDMARPTEAFRRMSTTDIRHRRPSTAEGADEPRAFLRTSDAARTTQVQPGMSTPYDPRAATMSTGYHAGGGPSFTTPPPNPLSPPALAPTPPRLSLAVHARSPDAGPSNVTWRGSSSSLPMPPQQQPLYPPTPQQQMYQQNQQHMYQQQQQGLGGGPALVRRKDSNALRPLPVSALMGAPPSAMGMSGSGSRSRSNSVRSTRIGTGVGTVQLPPLEPVTPLTMSLRSSPEDEQEREERERRERERERRR
ncbi:uncharacterized protein TRAVEDRAFT_23569 [Trametes versicolor FP-101664 SS1]|uniref:uncharacterized protein n=1 Tax=Trametes versicolor (strain FP-101664) TaxID=717944 RepID=UPI0004624699|nr:uncharacterized protein TRAVEDRAFT_23569 [Trametes versicolor FP-101664 SS1]EIW54531.1 hypothetical protein TRAVEDRAFT_23569 [Trametes versicolor FP-101664 SS1]